MTEKQITDGYALKMATEIECRRMAETARMVVASLYTLEGKKIFLRLSSVGRAGMLHLYSIWMPDEKNRPALFMGDDHFDYAISKGLIMWIWMCYKIYPDGCTKHLPLYMETRMLLDDMLSGGWYE